jgi:predicted kinase
MTTKTLILTVGLPRSGKSTYARSLGFPIVNPDSIRLALHGQRFKASAESDVWAIAKTMVKALFLAGHNTVVVDATSVTKKARDSWRSSDWLTEFHVLTTDKATCIKRARALQDDEIISVIERMAMSYEPPDSPFVEVPPTVGEASGLPRK